MSTKLSARLSVASVLVVCAGAVFAEPPFVKDRVLVKFKADVDARGAARAADAVRAKVDGFIDGAKVHILKLNNRNEEKYVERILKQRNDVEFAEPDWIYTPDAVPNDPYFGPQQWGPVRMSCPAAWDVTHGSPSVIIAILDSGVDPSHPDLAPNLMPGWNVVANNSNTNDVLGHGTTVAGVAGAAGNNGLGVCGVAWSCKLLPVKITNDTMLSTTASAISSGLNYAANNGARVANISYRCSDSASVASAAQAFMNRGGIVTIAAGNDGMQLTAPDNAYALTVGGTTSADDLASFSNYGTIVDLVAPGDVFTTYVGGGFGGGAGTSYSAPAVAGVAGLLLSANPQLTAQQLMSIITQSCDDLGAAGRDTRFGWGRVNAARALAMAGSAPPPPVDTTPPVVSFSAPGNGSSVSGVVTVTVAASDNVGVSSVTLMVNGAGVGIDNSAPYTFALDTSRYPNGAISLMVGASDAAGNNASAAMGLTVSNSPGDTQPPAVAITSPADGARISGNVTVAVAASDNVSVARVNLLVDGAVKASATSAPFSLRLNARKMGAGAHTLQVQALDAAGNVGQSAVIQVVR